MAPAKKVSTKAAGKKPAYKPLVPDKNIAKYHIKPEILKYSPQLAASFFLPNSKECDKYSTMYLRDSQPANWLLAGGSRSESQGLLQWPKSDLDGLVKWMNSNATELKRSETVYRGTIPWPLPVIDVTLKMGLPWDEHVKRDITRLLREFDAKRPVVNKHLVSTSADRSIASRFQSNAFQYQDEKGNVRNREARGYMHVLHLEPGCRVVQFEKCFEHEKERILVPGHTFTPVRRSGRTLHWKVSR